MTLIISNPNGSSCDVMGKGKQRERLELGLHRMECHEFTGKSPEDERWTTGKTRHGLSFGLLAGELAGWLSSNSRRWDDN